MGRYRVWGGSNVTRGGTIYSFTATDWRDPATYARSSTPLFPDLGPMGTPASRTRVLDKLVTNSS